jgi:CheY-like chemotaxis protein
MRCIVRKVLAATRFPLQVAEAVEGGEALALVRTADFVFVLFDQNLPGLSGLEAIAELRRAERNPDFVLISSTDDRALAAKAHAQGVALLQKCSIRRIWKTCSAASAGCARLAPHPTVLLAR